MPVDSEYSHSWARLGVYYSNLNLCYFIAALGLLYVLGLFTHRLFFSPLASIPGPWYAAISETWILSHMARLRGCRAIDDLLKKYGPIVRVAPNKVVFLDSATMKSVYSTSSRLFKSDFYKGMQINDLDHAMTTLDPVSHSARRKAFSPHYTQINISQFQPELHDFAMELLEYLDVTASYPIMTHDLLSLFRRLLSDLNCVHLFGYRNGSFRELSRDTQQVDDCLSLAIHDFPKMVFMRKALPRWLWRLITRVPNSRWRALCASDKIMHDFAKARVVETRTLFQSGKLDAEKMTLVERLLRHRYPGSGEMMAENDIICEVNAHLIAGSDTTATTLSYIFWELSRRPDIASELRAELDEVMPDPRRIPDIQVLQGLPYLSALVNEGGYPCLRVYSAVPSPLERIVPSSSSSDPFTLLGYTIPAGTIIATQAWSSHRLPRIFPYPDFFNPNRWLSDEIPLKLSTTGSLITPNLSSTSTLPESPVTMASETEKRVGIDEPSNTMSRQAHMMPFGVGPRSCGGQAMAQMVLRFIIVAIARNFDIITPAETNEQSMDIKDAFVIFPAGMTCRLGFVARKQS